MSRAELLRHGPLRALLVAEIVSTTGSQMTWLALPWFVLITTGSPARMTLVMAAELLGIGAFGLPSGALLQRFGARRTMLAADGLRAPLMLLVPVLHWEGALSFPVLLAIALALGVFGAPFFAAQRIIVPELLGEDERVIGQANALFQGAIRVTMLLGPPLGGVLIGWLGATSVLVVDAATYVCSFLLVGLFVPRRAAAAPTEETRGVLTGLRFLAREPLLRTWGTILIVGDIAWQAFFAAVPVLVVTHFGADARIAGVLYAAFGVGAVIGNVIVFRFLLDRIDGMRLIALAAPFQAAPLWFLPLHLPAVALAGALFASGLANGFANPSLHSILTLRMPPAIRAKAMTAFMTVFAMTMPLGVLGAGPILSAFGARPLLMAIAAIQSVTMGLLSLTALRARAPVPEPAPA